MVKLEIPNKVFLEAREMAKEMGQLKGSLTRGAGNLAGFLGEIMVREYLGAKQDNSYDHDLLMPDGTKIDVKTKRCTSEPKDFYEVSVGNVKQKCDKYVFTRVLGDYSTIWLLGEITKEDFMEKATERKKGDVDESNGFVFKANAHNMAISELDPV